MSLEALTCTNCGSGDVQEVKASTYFCNHCESVFKHADPAQVTVGPAFCEHGNPVDVQCQLCRTGMCSQRCDVVPAWGGGHGGVVRTRGFGYLEQGRRYNTDVEGPFLSVGKLLRSLALTCQRSLSHVCYRCVTQAVPVTAEYVSAGAICETVRCWSAPAGKCPCCQGGFCQKCSMPQVLQQGGGDWLRGLSVTRAVSAAVCAWDPEYDRASKTFPVGQRLPDGMCQPCLEENSDKAAALAAGICQLDYVGRLGLFPSTATGLRFPLQRSGVRSTTRNAAESRKSRAGTPPKSTHG